MRVLSAVFISFCLLITGCVDRTPHDVSKQVSEKDWATLPMRELLNKYFDARLLEFVAIANPDRLSPGDITVAGYLHHEGIGVPKDEARGMILLKRSCREEHMRGCALQGHFAIWGESEDLRADAVGVLTPACDADNLWACKALTVAYTHGVGTDVDAQLALKYANLSCSVPSASFCNEAARHLQLVNKPESLRLHNAACDAENAIACHNLAVAYGRGTFVDLDDEMSAAFSDKACLLGYYGACWSYLSRLRSGHARTDNPQFYIKRSRVVCQNGDALACMVLRSLYEEPEESGVSPNPVLAVKYGLLGCEAGHLRMCIETGDDYRDGYGTEQDHQTALKIYKKVCEAADPDVSDRACRSAAELNHLENEIGMTAILEESCRLGSGEDCRSAAWAYATGDKAEIDTERSIELFKLGCERKNAASCLDMGSLHEWAEFGFPEDKEIALVYYEKSCELDHKFGCKEMVRFYENAG